MRSRAPAPFVLLRPRGDASFAAKRLLLPPTFDALLQKAQSLLSLPSPVTLSTEDGTAVNSLHSIVPRMTLLASTEPVIVPILDDLVIGDATRPISEGKPPLLDDDPPAEEEEEEEADALVSDHEDEEAVEPGPVPLVEGLLGRQFCVGGFDAIVGAALEGDDVATFYERMLQEESTQQKYIFQNILIDLPRADALTDRESRTLAPSTVQASRDLVAKHRIVSPGCIAHHFRVLIVGPPKSGKSTFLAFIGEQFLSDLFISQTFKRNFVLVFDAKKLSVSFAQYHEFYSHYIDIIFAAIKLQRPGFRPFSDGVVNAFRAIVRGSKDASLPKAFTTHSIFRGTGRALTQVSIQLQQCFDDPAGFEAWHTNVLLLPALISSAFGFTQVHYVIDNLEYLGGQIQPEHPFVESAQPIDAGDYFKYALSSASWVAACEQTDECIRFATSDEANLNIIRRCQLETTFGLRGTVDGQDKAFMVRFDGDPRLFRFTVDDCGGCPAFLSFWEEVCREVDETTDPWNVDVAEYTEQQTSVKECLNHLLKCAFVAGEDETANVVQNEIW
jgi:hypothetical protein